MDMIEHASSAIDKITCAYDTDPEKLRNIVEGLHQNGVDSIRWNPMKTDNPNTDYQITYRENDYPQIQDYQGKDLSYQEFLMLQLGDRSDRLMKSIENQMEFLKTEENYFNDCMENIKNEMKDSGLNETLTYMELKDGPYQILWEYHSETDTLTAKDNHGIVSLDVLKDVLSEHGFFNSSEKTAIDDDTKMLNEAYLQDGPELEWAMHRILDEKAHAGEKSAVWHMEGNHNSIDVTFTRDKDGIQLKDENGKSMDFDTLRSYGYSIGVDNKLITEERDAKHYSLLEKINRSPLAVGTIALVAGERGRNHMAPLKWTAHGKEDVTFIIAGRDDGSPVLKDTDNREYNLYTMADRLESLGLLEPPEPDPVFMYSLEAKDKPQGYDPVHNNFFPDIRKNLDPKEVEVIRQSNPLYGMVDGKVDVTKPCPQIHLDYSTVKNILGPEFKDTEIKNVKAYIQNGRAMEVDHVKFGIMNRVYLDVDVKREDKIENVKYQAVVRSDGTYVYGLGKTDGITLHYNFPQNGERFSALDRLQINNPANWFGKEVEKKLESLEKNHPDRIEKFKKTPAYEGLTCYREAREFLREATGNDNITVSSGMKKVERLPEEKKQEWNRIVDRYDKAVSKIEVTIEKKFDTAARKVVKDEIDFRKSPGRMEVYFEKKLNFYIEQRNSAMDTRDKLVTYRNIKLDQMYEYQNTYRDASYAVTDHLGFGHEKEASTAIERVRVLGDDYPEYKQKCKDVQKVQGPIERCESYISHCEGVINDTLQEIEFVDHFNINTYDAMTTLKEYVYASSNFTDGTDMRDYSSVYAKDLVLIDDRELKEKIESYNEKQESDYYKVHIGKDGGVYTSFGIRLSYSYEADRSVRPHYYAADKNMKIEAASYSYKEEENYITSNGHMPVAEDAPMIGRDINADYTNAFNALRTTIPDTETQLVDVLEQVDRNFLGEKSAYQYSNIYAQSDLSKLGDVRYQDIIKNVLEHKDSGIESVKKEYAQRAEQLSSEEKKEQKDSVAKQKEQVIRNEKPAVRDVMYVKAKVDFNGKLNIRHSVMPDIIREAKQLAKENESSVNDEKNKIIDSMKERAAPVIERLQYLKEKMSDIATRLGDPYLLRENTYFQNYKMEYDYCARTLIDQGFSWGEGQFLKEYISKDQLKTDKMELRNSDFFKSYEQRIRLEGTEKIESDSFIKGTTYDYGKWFKVGDFLAKTIHRPYFNRIAKSVDREPMGDRVGNDKQEAAMEADKLIQELPDTENLTEEDQITSGEENISTTDMEEKPIENMEKEEPSAMKVQDKEEPPVTKESIKKEEDDTKEDAVALEEERLKDMEEPEEEIKPQEDTEQFPEESSPIEDSKDDDTPYQEDIWEAESDEPEIDESMYPSYEDIDWNDTEMNLSEDDFPDVSDVPDEDAINPFEYEEKIDLKEEFDKVFDGYQTTDDVVEKAMDDIFSSGSADISDVIKGAADSISDKLTMDVSSDDQQYYQDASADIAYEITDLDGKPMDNLQKLADILQENGVPEERTEKLVDHTGDRYETQGEYDSPDTPEMDIDPVEEVDLSDTEQYVEDLGDFMDDVNDAIEQAQENGIEAPEDFMSDMIVEEEDDPDYDISDIIRRLENAGIDIGSFDSGLESGAVEGAGGAEGVEAAGILLV